MHLPVPPRLLAPLVHASDRLLRGAVRWQVDDVAGTLDRARAGEVCLFACRHGQLWPLLWAVEDADVSIVVSRSGDGDLLAAVLRRRGFGLIRGSSTRDGRGAARGALRVLRSGRRVGVAVDGPRGPRGQVQDGVLRIAQRADVPIVPLRVNGGRPWVAPGSWDRFEVPRPGQRMRLRVGRPIRVGTGEAAIEAAGQSLAAALGGWRASDTSPLDAPWDPSAPELHGHPG